MTKVTPRNLDCLKPESEDNQSTFIELPWLNPDLSPNKRLGWRATFKPKQRAKNTGYKAAQSLVPPKADTYHLKITFHPPAYHNYDLDNCLATIKAELDGIADAWGVNDKQFRPITIDFGVKVEGGMIAVSVVRKS